MILTKTNRVEGITPVLQTLHVFQCVTEMLLLVYKSLNGSAPKHSADLLVQCATARSLQISGTSMLAVPRITTKLGEASLWDVTRGSKVLDSLL